MRCTFFVTTYGVVSIRRSAEIVRARAILRSGQTPPPGTWMLFRTKVSTGASAKIDAWFGYAAGATLLAGVAWLLALYLSSGDVALMVLGLRECR